MTAALIAVENVAGFDTAPLVDAIGRIVTERSDESKVVCCAAVAAQPRGGGVASERLVGRIAELHERVASVIRPALVDGVVVVERYQSPLIEEATSEEHEIVASAVLSMAPQPTLSVLVRGDGGHADAAMTRLWGVLAASGPVVVEIEELGPDRVDDAAERVVAALAARQATA